MSTDAGGAFASNDVLGPVPDRWYAVTNDGRATLCASERDARESCASFDFSWPRSAPHRAVLLGDVAAERERWESLRAWVERSMKEHYGGQMMSTSTTPQPTNKEDSAAGNVKAIKHIAYSEGYADGKAFERERWLAAASLAFDVLALDAGPDQVQREADALRELGQLLRA